MAKPTTAMLSPNGRTTGTARPEPRPVLQPRRQLPWMVAGVVLVVGFALVFATVSVRAGGGREVLVAARSLPAGQPLTAGDLRAVRVSGPGASGWLSPASEAGVVGRPTAAPLVAGVPLSAAEVGPGSGLVAGQDMVAVALKAGQFPPALAAGDRVAVVATQAPGAGGPTGSGGTSQVSGGAGPLPARVVATVTGIDPNTASSDSTTVVSLQVGDSDAGSVARLAAAGQVALVLLAPGAGS